jgi:hypothetical protein
MKKLLNFILDCIFYERVLIREAKKELKPLRVKYYELCNKEARGTDANDELRRMLAINKRKQDSIKYGLANSLLHCEGYGDNNR